MDHWKLLERLEGAQEVPFDLTAWIKNCITTRNISLGYPDSPRRTHEVDKGIPQGSHLAPLRLVIYVKPLHLAMNSSEFFTTFDVDDFQIMVAGNSWERNARKLEAKAA